MKIVINSCYGGFSISLAAAQHMAAAGSLLAQKEINSPGRFYGYGYVDGVGDGYDRGDPLLVAAVEALGDAANGGCAKLRVVEIPDGTDYEIDEYDGFERVAEKHRTWG